MIARGFEIGVLFGVDRPIARGGVRRDTSLASVVSVATLVMVRVCVREDVEGEGTRGLGLVGEEQIASIAEDDIAFSEARRKALSLAGRLRANEI